MRQGAPGTGRHGIRRYHSGVNFSSRERQLLSTLVIPGLVAQLNDLVTRAPEYGDRAAREAAGLQVQLERAGVPVKVTELYGAVPSRLSEVAGAIAHDALGVVSATAAVLFDATLVLIIAFIMLIDGDAIWQRFTPALTPELRSEAELLRQRADRSLGGS